MNSDPPFPPEPSVREQLLRASAEAIIEQATLSEAHPNHATHSASMRVEALLHELQVYRVELEMQNETLRESQIALEASHKCYMDLYDLAPVGYLTLSQAGLILQINPMGATLLGEPRQNLNLRSFAQFVADDHRNCWNEFVISLWGKKFEKSVVAHTHHCELSLLRNDGNRFYVRLDCRRSQLEGVETLHITLIDITQQRDNEEQSRIAAIAFETQESMLITDANGLIVRANSAFTKRTGYSVNEAIGLPIDALSVGHHDPAYFRQMRETANQNGVWQGELWNCNKLGRDCVQWLTLSAVVSPAGAISHYVAAITDTSSSKQAEAEIHRLAYYDTLTGLPNRRLFFDRMRQAMLRSSRDTNFGALIFLDLDNFKRLNDTQGHSVGDQFLVGIAKSILLCVRERDTVARLG